MEHIRNFTAILSAVKLSRKQHVHVSVSERGLTFVAVDDSKSLQAQAWALHWSPFQQLNLSSLEGGNLSGWSYREHNDLFSSA